MRRNTKGFTLMEMLIGVAIVAILVAIAIPAFSATLNKARVAADAANIRAGYAKAMAMVLDNTDYSKNTAYYLMQDGSIKEGGMPESNRYKTQGNASAEGVAPIQIAGQTVKKWRKGQTLYYRVLVDASGSMTLDIVFPGTG